MKALSRENGSARFFVAVGKIKMTIGEWAARLRYRYVPDHVVGEVLGRRWMDNVIPVTLLIALSDLSCNGNSEFHLGRKHLRHCAADRRIGTDRRSA